MRVLSRLTLPGSLDFLRICGSTNKMFYSSSTTENLGEEEEFRKLELVQKRVRHQRRTRKAVEVGPPRYKKMSVTQDWPSVWPTQRTFHPATVPLPLHQGLVRNPKRAAPNKWANLELMKIPNFLHLTPPAIVRHCEALKRFCTPWPEALNTTKRINKEFPVEVTSSDYCHSSPSLRDHRARIVTIRFHVSSLKFDEHSKDKFFRLVGDRYDPGTGYVTITTDCCPLRQQNYDYAMYLLTALYHESWETEPWEEEKLEDDMERYVWEQCASKQRLCSILSFISENNSSAPESLKAVTKDDLASEKIISLEPVKQYKEAITDLHDKGETQETVVDYGKSVRKLFNLPLD